MKKLEIALCEDDKYFIESEKELIVSVMEEKGLVFGIDAYMAAEDMLKKAEKYDTIFLDIKMEGMDGIEAAKAIHRINRACLIIFVTGYGYYMDSALNEHAFRFWQKPIDRERLSYAIDSAVREFESCERYIELMTEGGTRFVRERDIIYVCTTSARRKLKVVTAAEEIAAAGKFEDISKSLLENGEFAETHRGYVVNLRFVRKIHDNTVACGGRDKYCNVYLSRRKRKEFTESYMRYLRRQAGWD